MPDEEGGHLHLGLPPLKAMALHTPDIFYTLINNVHLVINNMMSAVVK